MGSLSKAGDRHFFLLVLLFALFGCSSQSGTNQQGQNNAKHIQGSNNAEGGYDLGGGKTFNSPPDLVIRTIELAQSIAGEASWETNVYKHFFISFGRNSIKGPESDIGRMFPLYRNTSGFNGNKMSQSPALEAIAQKKITLLEKGDCPKPPEETTADASVTKHDLDGEVCFSVGNLTKVAPSDLTRQVMGLMLHEAVHLAGGDEALAKNYQDSFDVYFGSRFGEMIGEAYLNDVGGRIYRNVLEFVDILDYIQNRVDTSFIYARFAKVYGQLTNIQGIHDPIALRIRLFLMRKDTPELFVQRLTEFLADLDKEFRLKDFGPYGFKPHTHEELAVIAERHYPKIREINSLWKKIEKEALCDDDGNYFKKPEAWVLSKVCGTPKP